ncbi:MAG: arylamine N-acetyltransferase, partial [Chroococcidiopsidaceae cyanobacterium CP_BM_RX_35]|nr:arylamine N-acetyltransferase [Chroococcidiopsidaceae cyanobacterium CP_BM_RX_35]
MSGNNLLELDAYLERIAYHGSLTPCEETLYQLQRAQALSIPFENLDIFLGRPICLDPASLVTKLVKERRGGYCYELNGLFLMVLQHLGFTVTSMAARLVKPNGSFKQRSHQMMLVEIGEKRWLVDVGFGGNCPIEPIPFELDVEFDQILDTFRIKAD